MVAQLFFLLFGEGADVEEHDEDEIWLLKNFNFSLDNSSYRERDDAFLMWYENIPKNVTSLPNIALLNGKSLLEYNRPTPKCLYYFFLK